MQSKTQNTTPMASAGTISARVGCDISNISHRIKGGLMPPALGKVGQFTVWNLEEVISHMEERERQRRLKVKAEIDVIRKLAADVKAGRVERAIQGMKPRPVVLPKKP